jgi:hypothetical protein
MAYVQSISPVGLESGVPRSTAFWELRFGLNNTQFRWVYTRHLDLGHRLQSSALSWGHEVPITAVSSAEKDQLFVRKSQPISGVRHDFRGSR